MKTHTSQFKNQIKQFGRELDSKITYELNGETIELGSEELNSITPHYQSALLKSTMKQLDIDSNVEIPEGTIINYQLGVKVGNSYEYLNYGNYIVYSVEKQEDKYSYMIKCYDKMLYAMKDYKAMEITYPITIRDFINAICGEIGLTFKNTNENFVNFNKEIPEELYLSTEGTSIGYTFRDVLDEIAEATASNICINEDDELEIRYIQDVGELRTASGSNITIPKSEAIELQEFEVKGNTTQANTPTPDNPSELVSVGIKNLYDYTDISYIPPAITTDDDGWITITYDNSSGSSTAYMNYYTNNLDLKTSSNYYLLVEVKNVSGTGSINFNSTATNAGQFTSSSNYNFSALENGSKILLLKTTKSDFTNIIYGLRTFATFTTGQSGSITFRLSVYETAMNEYIPYGKYGIEVKTTGKNLWGGFSNTFSVGGGGITFTSNSDGSITLNGTATANVSRPYSADAVNNNWYLTLQAGTYTISCNNLPTGVTLTVTNTTGTNLYTRITSSRTFTLNSETSFFVRADIPNGASIDNKTIYIQIERGTTATEYEPYQGNTYLYTLDEPLRGIGDTKDRLFIENNTLKVERKIGSIVLDGSEDEGWLATGTVETNKNRFRTSLIANNVVHVINANIVADIKSNYFKAVSTNDTYLCNNGIAISTAGTIFIYDDTLNNLDVNGFKTWLSTHNTEVQYILAEPYTEEIGTVQIPSTYEGITHIDANGVMNITYMSEFETIDEEYLKDVNVNFGEKFGPVNTIILSRSGGSDKIAQSIPSDIADEDKIAMEIIDNQIMNDNNRADFIPEILNKLNGLEYYINDFTSTGICYLDLCDRYRVKVFNNTYRCIMLNDEANITQGLEESIYTEKPEETDTEYKYTSSDDRKVNQTYIIAKKNEGTIEAVVEAVSGEEGLTQRIERVETKQTSTDFRINAISRNVTYTDFDEEGNPTNSKINQVETTTGFTFNAEGMTIEDSSSNFKALHRNDGTYYKEGDNIVGQYTKDGSKQKDLELFGVYYYGKNDFPDTPMFIAQIFTDESGESGFGHFYNRGD